jgi:hypothetical protein
MEDDASAGPDDEKINVAVIRRSRTVGKAFVLLLL